MYFAKFIPLICGAMLLANCDGAIVSQNIINPDKIESLPAFGISYDSATDVVTITPPSGAPLNATLNTTAGIPNLPYIGAYIHSGSATYVIYGRTPSGGGSVTSLVESGAREYRAFERHFDTDLPVSGSSDFAGDYMAIYFGLVGNTIAGHIDGKAQLTADFTNGTISGLIHSRANSGGQAMNDVTLTPGTILPGLGRIVGTTTGGRFLLGGFSARTGNYHGYIVGPNGEELVGLVDIIHDINGLGTYTEVGGIVGLKQ